MAFFTTPAKQGRDVQCSNPVQAHGRSRDLRRQRDGNWNLNKARIITRGMTLETTRLCPTARPPYYVDVVLNAECPRNKALLRHSRKATIGNLNLGRRRPGYSFGTTKDIALIASLVGARLTITEDYDPLEVCMHTGQ